MFSAKVAGTILTRYRVSRKGELKNQDGLLVSKSLTLPFAPPWVRWISQISQKNMLFKTIGGPVVMAPTYES